MTESLVKARQSNPSLFREFQRSDNGSNGFDTMVKREIAKGCGEIVANQRVANNHPDALREHIAKGRAHALMFESKVAENPKARRSRPHCGDAKSAG